MSETFNFLCGIHWFWSLIFFSIRSFQTSHGTYISTLVIRSALCKDCMNLIGCQVTKWFLCEQLSPVYLLKVASSCKTGGTEGPGGPWWPLPLQNVWLWWNQNHLPKNDHELMPPLQICGPSSGPELHFNTWHSILNFCIHIRLEESYNNGFILQTDPGESIFKLSKLPPITSKFIRFWIKSNPFKNVILHFPVIRP